MNKPICLNAIALIEWPALEPYQGFIIETPIACPHVTKDELDRLINQLDSCWAAMDKTCSEMDKLRADNEIRHSELYYPTFEDHFAGSFAEFILPLVYALNPLYFRDSD